MFEALVISLINKFLGDFVDNVKAEQLNIGLWSGDVVLENVALKRHALDALNLPIDIKYGFLGKLTLKIPWKNLKGEPLYVNIDRIYALAAPKFARKYNAEEEEKEKQELKKTMLERLETFKAQKPEVNTGMSKEKEADFVTKLATKIIDNLQVTIGAIHIRYEDALSNPAHPIAVGLTLNQLTALSCNPQWVEGINKSSETGPIFKLAKLDSFSVYWDSFPTLWGDLAPNDLREKLTTVNPKSSQKQEENHPFVLKPLSASVKLRLDPRPNPPVTSPQVMADIAVEDFGLVLDDLQFQDVMKVTSFFAAYVNGEKYRKFRPSRELTIKQNPRVFWKFAQEAVLSDVHDKLRRLEWKFFKQRRDDRKTYIELYKSNKIKEKSDVKDKLEKLEKTLEYADIAFYRSIAEAQLKKEKAVQAQEKAEKAKKSWFSGILGGGGKKDVPEVSEDQMLKDLYDTIDYDDSVPPKPAVFPPTYEQFKFTFVLRAIQIGVRNRIAPKEANAKSAVKPILDFALTTLKADAVVRPGSMSLKASLQQMVLVDQFSADTIYPKMLNAAAGPKGSFLTFEFHDHPLDSPDTDMLVDLKMDTIEVILPLGVLVHTIKSFTPPPDDYLSALQEIALENLSKATEQSRLGLAHQLDLQKSLDLRVDIKAPVILVPQKINAADGVVLMLDLGRVGVKSNPVSAETKKALSDPTKVSLEDLRKLAYDRFHLNLEALQVVLAESMADARLAAQVTTAASTKNHILARTNLVIILDKCIIPNDANLPAVKVSAHLPSFAIKFSDFKFQVLMRLVASIMPYVNDLSSADASAPSRAASSQTKSQLIQSAATIESSFLTIDENVSSSSVAQTPLLSASAEVNLLQKQIAAIAFVLEEISVSFLRETKEAEVPVASFKISGLQLNLLQRDHDLNVNVSLSVVKIEDVSNSALSYSLVELSPKGNISKALDFNFLQVSRQSPSFVSSGAYDQTISATIATLAVTVEANSLVQFIAFFKSAFQLSPEVQKALAGKSEPAKAAIEEGRPRSSTTLSSMAVQKKPVTKKAAAVETTIHIEAALQGIAVLFVSQKQVVLAKSSFGLTRAIVDVEGDVVKVHSDLGALWFESIVKGQSAPLGIVTTTAEHTLSIDVAIYPKESSKWPGHDMSIKLKVMTLDVLFVPEAIEELVGNLIKFTALKDALQDQIDAAAATATESLQKAGEAIGEQLMLLDVVVQAPHVTVRKSLVSVDFIEVFLGEISLKNEFEKLPEVPATVDVMAITLSKVAVKTSYAVNKTAVIFNDPLVAEFAAKINVRRLIIADPTKATVPMIEIGGSTLPLQVQFSNRQVYFLLGFVDDLLIQIESLQKVVEANMPAPAAPTSAITPTTAGAIEAAPSSPESAVTSAVETLKPIHSLDVSFFVASVGLLILSEDATLQAGTPDRRQKLMDVAIENIAAKVSQFSNSELQVEVQIKSIGAHDKRALASNYYRDILDSGQFAMQFSQAGNGAQLINVNINDFTATVATELLLSVADILLVPMQDYQHMKKQAKEKSIFVTPEVQPAVASEPISTSLVVSGNNSSASSSSAISKATALTVQPSKSSSVATSGSAASAAKPAPELKVFVNILGTKLRIIGDSKTVDSPGLILHNGSLTLKLVGSDINLEVAGTSIVTAAMAISNDVSAAAAVFGSNSVSVIKKQDVYSDFQMLEPFTASISIKNSTSITISSRPLNLRISYQDIALLLAIVDIVMPQVNNSAALNPEKRLKSGSSKDLERLEDVVLNVVKLSTTASQDDDASADDKLVIAQDDDEKASANPESLIVKFEGISLTVINDFGDLNVPLFKFKVDGSDIIIKNWSNKLMIHAPLGIRGDFFNNKYSSWETVIEQWNLEASVRKESTLSGADVLISSENSFEIAATGDLIDTAITIGGQWADGLKTKALPSVGVRKEFHPYHLRNQLGVNVVISVAAGERDQTSTTFPLSVRTNSEVGFALDDWHKLHKGVFTKTQAITIEFEGGQFETLKEVPLDRLGVCEFELVGKLDKSVNHRIAVDVSFQGGHRVVVLRSPVVLENLTEGTIVLKVSSVGLPDTQLTLAPHDTKGIPLAYCYSYQFTATHPTNGYQASKPVQWRNLLLPVSTELVESYNIAEQKGVNYRVIPTLELSDASIDGVVTSWKEQTYPTYKLRFVTPWILENLLPCDMDISVFSPSGALVEQKVLTPGQLTSFVNAPYDGTHMMSIDLADMNYHTQFPVRLLELGEKSGKINSEPIRITNKTTPKDNELMLKVAWTPFESQDKAELRAYRKLTISVPYVIINKTGAHLIFKQAARLGGLLGQSKDAHVPVNASSLRTADGQDMQLILFSYGKFELLTKQGVTFRTADSEWSAGYSLEGTGSSAEVQLDHQKDIDIKYQFGMDITIGQGKYSNSKVITFTPRYVVVNNTDVELQFLLAEPVEASASSGSGKKGLFGTKSKGSASTSGNLLGGAQPDVKVPAGQRTALHFAEDNSEHRLIRLRAGTKGTWSPPFHSEGLDVVYVKQDSPSSTARHHVYRIEKIVERATVFLQVHLHKDPAPFRVDNYSGLEISFQQKNSKTRYTAPPAIGLPFVWDDPLDNSHEIQLFVENQQHSVDLSLIGHHKGWTVTSSKGKYKVKIDVFPEASTVVVRLTGKAIIAKDSKAIATVKSIFKTASSASKKDDESVNEASEDGAVIRESKPVVSIKVRLAGLGLSVISKKPMELIRLGVQDIQVDFVDADIDQTLQLFVGNLQIDNQLPLADFPVLLRPIIMKNRKNAEGKDAETRLLNMSYRMLKHQSVGVQTFQYLSILLQELSVEVSESFLMVVLQFALDLVPKQTKQSSLKDLGDLTPGLPLPPATSPVGGDKIYFEMLEIQPIKVSITFVRSNERGTASATEIIKSDLVRIVVDVLSNALANIENAPIALNALAVKHLMASTALLGDIIGKHYTYQIVSQMHKLVGSVDLIGNPVGLFGSISTGVEDFFYEPYQGLTRGPKDFALGVGTGSISLVRNLGFGVFNTASKITGSVGKGVAQITFDDKYMAERDAARIANRNQSAAQGSLTGATTVLQGFASGVTGLFTKPIEGAKEGGFAGFLSGTAKGVVGVVAKPVVGILDGASQVAVGLRNATRNDLEVVRQRLPRQFGPDHILKPFNPSLAYGCQLLHTIDAGDYGEHLYVAHQEIVGTHRVLILSDMGVMLVSLKKQKAKWVITYRNLATVESHQDAIALRTLKQKEGSAPAQLIECPDENARQTLIVQIKEQQEAFRRSAVGFFRAQETI